VDTTECESSQDSFKMMCGADFSHDAWDQCMNRTNNDVPLGDCLSEVCAVMGGIFQCGMTEEEADCVANKKCQWSASESSCGYDMAASLPDGCAFKNQVSNSCKDVKTQEGCVGECTWFAKDADCRDDGVYSEGACELTNAFPDGDQSQKAYSDMMYILKSCAGMATEATCLGLVPVLAGDYQDSKVSSGVGIQLGASNLAAVTLSIFFLLCW